MTKTVFALLFLTSLATAGEPVASATRYDEYTKATGISTENYNIPGVGSFFNPANAFAHIAGNVTDQGKESMYLKVHYEGSGWRFFNSAVDIDGTQLPVDVIDRQVMYSDHIAESFLVYLSRSYLENHVTSGLNIRFDGKYGQLIVKLPSEYIVSFLEKLSEIENAVRSKISMRPAIPTAQRVKLGVQYTAVTSQIASFARLDYAKGVMIASITENSPAHKAGMAQGDVILKANGIDVPNTMTGLSELMQNFSSGMAIPFVIWRNNAEQTITVQF